MPDYICPDFNKLCTELGLQCTMTIDTRTYLTAFQYKNLGDRPVAFFQDEMFKVLYPGGEWEMFGRGLDTCWMAHWDEQKEHHLD